MTFKRIDSTAYSADKTLSSFLLRRNRDNLQAHLDDRPVQGVWTPHAYNTSTGALVLPEISGYGEGSCVVLPFWVPPRTTALGVIVEQQVATTVTASPYTDEITLRATAIPLARWLDPPSRGRALTSWTSSAVAGNASASSATELTLDVSTHPAGWTLVVVAWTSGEASSWTQIVDGGASGPNCLTGWYPGHYVLDSTTVTGMVTGAQAPHWIVQLADTGGKASTSTAAPLFTPRKVLLIEDDGTGAQKFSVNVWPPLTDVASDEARTSWHNDATDALWYKALGVATLSGVTVYTKTADDLTAPGARLDAPQPVALRVVTPEVQEQVTTWLTRPRVHAMGPLPLLAQTDWTSYEPANRINGSIELGTGYKTLAMAPVGGDDPFQRRPQGSGAASTYTKTAVEVFFVYAVLLPANVGGQWAWDLDWRLRLVNRDAATTAVDFVTPRVGVPARATPTGWRNRIGLRDFSDLALLACFPRTADPPQTQERTTMSGVLPVRALRDVAVQVEILSAVDSDTDVTRTLMLQVRAKDGDDPAQTSGLVASEYAPRIHLLSWAVVSKPYLEREPTIAEVGV